MKNTCTAAGVGLTALLGGNAFAQDANIVFNGTIGDSCTVVADSPGTLGVNGTNTVLASTEGAGAAGQASVTATSGTFQVTVDAPTSFDTAPAGANTNTSFAASYDASGATTAAGVDGATPTSLNAGVTTVAVNASATKSSGIFESGSYTFTAIVRCQTP